MASRICWCIFSTKRSPFSTTGLVSCRRPTLSVGGAIPPQWENRLMQQQQEKICTIHIFYEETEPPMVDADPDAEPESAPPQNRLALICLSIVACLCLA